MFYTYRGLVEIVLGCALVRDADATTGDLRIDAQRRPIDTDGVRTTREPPGRHTAEAGLSPDENHQLIADHSMTEVTVSSR